MSPKQECMEILKQEGINPASTVDYEINSEETSLTLEYIIETYMSASQESRLVFITALKKAAKAKDMGIKKFFEGMGQLLLMSQLSNKFEI